MVMILNNSASAEMKYINFINFTLNKNIFDQEIFGLASVVMHEVVLHSLI